MEWDMKVLNGTIVDGATPYKGNIYVREGKITVVTPDDLPGEAQEVVDASNKYVLPGLIDTHVHSRDPGPTYKEDFYYSTKAAAMGGITTMFEMPNTTPPLNNASNFERQRENLQSKAHIDFGLWGICLGELNNKDIRELDAKGVIGFKFFWGYAINKQTYQLIYNYKEGMENIIPPYHDGEVYKMMEEVAKTGKVFAVHAENNDLIQTLTDKVEAHGGKTYEDFLNGRPNLAELLTVQTGIEMAKATGVRFHVLHVSSGEAVKKVQEAQRDGYPVTVETCPHYLFLCNEDYEKVGAKMKVYPPVKYKKDQEMIMEALAEGTISHVCSDHAPHTVEEKDGDLFSIPAGMCGVETMAPLMLNAVNEQKLSLTRFVQVMSEEPAKLFGIYPQKGSLLPGSDADITIVDMEKEMTIKQEDLHSKSKITAFDGYKIKGSPVQTIVRGKTIMKDGRLLGRAGDGQLVRGGA